MHQRNTAQQQPPRASDLIEGYRRGGRWLNVILWMYVVRRVGHALGSHLPRHLLLSSMVLGLTIALLYLRGLTATLAPAVVALQRLPPGSLGVALGLSCLSMVISGVVWSRLLEHLGVRVSLHAALSAFLCAGLACYLLSTIGRTVGGAVSLRRRGVGAQYIVRLTLLANLLGFSGALIWAAASLPILAQQGTAARLPLVGSHGALVAGLILVALLFGTLSSIWVLARTPSMDHWVMHRLRIPAALPGGLACRLIRPAHLLALVLWSAAGWLGGSLALYPVLSALHPGVVLNMGSVIGSAALAATLGSLVFFVPVGIGVSDRTMIVLLTQATGLPLAQCVAAALAMRALDLVSKVFLLSGLAIGASLRRVYGAHRPAAPR